MKKPSVLARFTAWRRQSDAWVYSLLALCWCGITYVISAEWGWLSLVIISATIFLATFEIGWGAIAWLAWASMRHEDKKPSE